MRRDLMSSIKKKKGVNADAGSISSLQAALQHVDWFFFLDEDWFGRSSCDGTR
jgi:hypothetical protein